MLFDKILQKLQQIRTLNFCLVQNHPVFRQVTRVFKTVLPPQAEYHNYYLHLEKKNYPSVRQDKKKFQKVFPREIQALILQHILHFLKFTDMPDTTSHVEYQQGNFLSMQHQAMENYTGVPTKEVRRLFLVCFTFIPHSLVPPS